MDKMAIYYGDQACMETDYTFANSKSSEQLNTKSFKLSSALEN
jgi:hypothetical protein